MTGSLLLRFFIKCSFPIEYSMSITNVLEKKSYGNEQNDKTVHFYTAVQNSGIKIHPPRIKTLIYILIP